MHRAVDKEVGMPGLGTRRQMCQYGYQEADVLGGAQGGGCTGKWTRRHPCWSG